MSAHPVFVDTSALLALVNVNDAHHGEAIRIFRELAAAEAPLVTHSYVLVEAGALVRRRFGPAAFNRVGETVRRSALVVWVDERLHCAAWEKAAAGGRKGPGLVDHVSFLVMREMDVGLVATFDGHFSKQGFRTLP
ncbi:MAG: type II toxin-antitoxin system VapC family toxin [Deltaproteobacteria bacterium]|nr:type II toxin-antitoxin system VapC family toxin [Deltaproteobacteria bacterium]